MLHFDILRHGESDLSHTLRGQTDDALTASGWSQMQSTINRAIQSPVQWQVIVSSPLQRCAQFAETLAAQLQLPLIYQSGLQEMFFGDWEAQATADIYAHSPELLANFWQFPTRFTPPNAEPLTDFQLRVMNAITELQMVLLQHRWSHALVISHGGVIKLLKCLALQQDLNQLLSQEAALAELHAFQISAQGELMMAQGNSA